MRGRPPCDLYLQPGGCRFGANCRFAHSNVSPPHAVSSPSARSSTPRGRGRGGAMRGGPVNRQGPAFRPKQDLDDADLTAIASVAGSDSVAGGSGGWVDHRLLKAFLSSDSVARFATTYDMYRFLSALLASSRISVVWTPHDASDVIAEIGPATPGIARLAEIVTKPFSTTAGFSPQQLSFQRGFLVLAMYLTSDAVKNTHLVSNVNAMYSVLRANTDWIPATIHCVNELIARKTVAEEGLPADGAIFRPDNFPQVFLPLAQLLHEYLSRFSDAIVKSPQLDELISTLSQCFQQYSNDLFSPEPTFIDPLSKQDVSRRRFALDNVKRYLSLLPRIAKRTQARPFPQTTITKSVGQTLPPGVLSMLFEYMQMPGELRPDGPRHDNDFANFRDIAILPTHAELTSTAPPFVPANLPEAPHHLEGMERQLDILFRLTREDFVGPLRSAIQSLIADLRHLDDAKNALARLLKAGGGRYRPDSASFGGDSSDLIIYRDVEFTGLSIERHELELQLQLTLPPAWAKSKSNMVVRHLSAGNLVGLLIVNEARMKASKRAADRATKNVRIELGVVASDLEGSQVKVSFLQASQQDDSVYLHALNQLARDEKARLANDPLSKPVMYLFELPGFLLSTVEPFLAALKHLSPPAIPFADILSAKPPPKGQQISIEPPLYARNPGFTFDLSCLLSNNAPSGTLRLQVTDPQSAAHVTRVLAQPGASKLDATQAQAMVDCLCREVALVEGPPGTGESWLGVELIRVLLNAKVGRILILSYTNHALDEMLKHLIEKSVTTNIVRCGSRSEEESLQKHSLFNLCQLRDRPGGTTKRQIGRAVAARKAIEEEIRRVCELASQRKGRLEYDDARSHLCEFGMADAFLCVPPYLRSIINEMRGWEVQATKTQHVVLDVPREPRDIFAWWRAGTDLKVRELHEKQRRHESKKLVKQHRSAKTQQIEYTKMDGRLAVILPDTSPQAPENDDAGGDQTKPSSDAADGQPAWREPTSKRKIGKLISDGDVWNFSRWERLQLMQHIAETIICSVGPQLARLQSRLADLNATIKSYNDEERLDVLRAAEVIGATTNGCANIVDLISKVRPAIVLVEEAGECLEVQVVANLVGSVQHCISIGDHLQLRPSITSFSLSVDSARGAVHRHDVSLFERLAQLPVSMSVLQTQRRMRPEISKLVANYLYPHLENAPDVQSYPDVKGMKRDVYFIDHTLKEDTLSALHASRTNRREADWVVDLVRHLLLQGGLKAKSIAVLTPYLGQVRVLQEAFTEQKVMVILDERDIGDLEAEGDDLGAVEPSLMPKAREEQLSSRVILRTVDRFQGEEADIVILSLVRNSGSPDDEEGRAIFSRDVRASIGFLKSPNRTNVALSRAKIGMYIFGSASLLRSKAPMWESIVCDLEQDGAVGPLLPACCDGHPKKSFVISEPGVLPKLAPFGGCMAACNASLACGHLCPRVCHPMDRAHKYVKCTKPCPTLLDCGHPCGGLCSDTHPRCTFVISSVDLPCGHRSLNVPCFLAQNPEEVVCKVKIEKLLPCGHRRRLDCAVAPATYKCKEVCGAALDCVHKVCAGRCSDCSDLRARGDEFGHIPHAHGKMRLCGHECVGNCFEHVKEGACPLVCTAPCTRTCAHSSCTKKKNEHACSQPCPSCMQPCDSPECDLPCAVPDSNLPRDVPCAKKLKCGCPCPSLKGEPCARQVCPKHASPSVKAQVVDLLMLTKLGDYEREVTDALSSLITLDCGHAFTAETLDGSFGLDDFYEKDEAKTSYTALKYPSEEKARPVCPTCKHVVSSCATVRYRRAIKFGDLCLQERLRIARADEQLRELTKKLDAIDMTEQLEKVAIDKPGTLDSAMQEEAAKKRHAELTKHQRIATPFVFNDNATVGLTPSLLRAWRLAAQEILRVYADATEIVLYRSPHMQAYDAAVTKRFAEAKARLLGSDKPYDNLDEVALRMAKVGVGIVPLTTDDRLALKATWITLEARFLLLDVVRAILAALKTTVTGEKIVKAVYDLGIFILRTVDRDVERAIELAEQTTSRRLALEGYLYHLRAAYESSRFVAQTGLRYGMIDRADAIEQAAAKERQAAREFERAVQAAVAAQPSLATLLETDLRTEARRISDDWTELIKTLRRGSTFYEEVSTQERVMIVKAMNFATTGHFYKCPNGHSFTIGDCGGAMQTSDCPECGAKIGGGSHRLLDSNTNDLEMDRLAVETGARRDYPWGMRE